MRNSSLMYLFFLHSTYNLPPPSSSSSSSHAALPSSLLDDFLPQYSQSTPNSHHPLSAAQTAIQDVQYHDQIMARDQQSQQQHNNTHYGQNTQISHKNESNYAHSASRNTNSGVSSNGVDYRYNHSNSASANANSGAMYTQHRDNKYERFALLHFTVI